MSVLTTEEMKFLEKRENQRKEQAKRQAIYRQRQQEKNNEYKVNYNQYMKDYNQKQKEKEQTLKKRLINDKIQMIIPETEELLKAAEYEEVDKRTRRGRQQLRTSIEIKASYETRQKPLKLSTLNTYLRQIKIIHKKLKDKDLSGEVKCELKKLLNNYPKIDEMKIINEMEYLNDAELIISTIKKHYKNANSFKTYLNIIVVVLSHLKSLNKVYQTLTKVNKDVNKQVQDERDENTLTEEERIKIIDLERETIIRNLEKLGNVKEKLIFGLYTLQPPRRLEYRHMKITKEIDESKLRDENYLIISTKPKKFVFNDYKTSGAYNQKIIEVKDELLDNIIDKYIGLEKRNDGEYLISTEKDRRLVIEQSNFSNLLSKIFNKAYGIRTNLDYIRKSHIIHFLKSPKSNKQKKEFAEMMAHSIDEQSKYYKIL
jgi:hypothetical protein